MSVTTSTPIQILRSIVLGKRPDSARLLPGQPAVNTNAGDPGFFFADSTGSKLIKVGPCTVSPIAPNSTATPPGNLGNSAGELWFDTSGDAPILKIYTEDGWFPAIPPAFSTPLVQDITPEISQYPDNTQWWNSGTGQMFILYNDGTSRQWTQVTSSVAR
jgi:hypothetical protein